MTQHLPPDRSETVFTDYKPALTAAQAVAEANRCLFCSDAPCMQACPTHIDVAQFIRKISTGNVEGSARTIFSANILGMSCARVCPVEVLCAGSCVLHQLGREPIAIGKLQRFATDEALAKGLRFFTAGAPTGKKVACLGGGPASLACAHELRRQGHAVTIFEQRPTLGGLNVTGVAPHKLRSERALEEVDWVLGIGGIEVKAGVTVGKDVTLEQLEADFDAVFVGVGLGADARLGVPGEDLPGVHGAVAWIEKMKLGKVDTSKVRRCVVVGGGNTAIDAVREAKTLGIPEVTMVYRGSLAKMSGYAHEWEAAALDGVRAEWHALPVGFEGGSSVARVNCARLDDQRRPVAGENFTLEADLVLMAIGQGKLGAQVAQLPGITHEKGRLLVDAKGSLSRAKWYAGGDCANGGTEVVNAAAEGKTAAQSIHAFLTGVAHG